MTIEEQLAEAHERIAGWEEEYGKESGQHLVVKRELAEARWALGSIRDNVTAVQAVGAHEFAGRFLAGQAPEPAPHPDCPCDQGHRSDCPRGAPPEPAVCPLDHLPPGPEHFEQCRDYRAPPEPPAPTVTFVPQPIEQWGFIGADARAPTPPRCTCVPMQGFFPGDGHAPTCPAAGRGQVRDGEASTTPPEQKSPKDSGGLRGKDD